MIDRETENMIPLRQVPDHVPSRCTGKRLSPATVWRWTLRSANPLETIVIGGGRFTSREAIDRFIQRANDERPALPSPPTSKAKRAGDVLRKLIGGGNAT
jgi:hypothetical protein